MTSRTRANIRSALGCSVPEARTASSTSVSWRVFRRRASATIPDPALVLDRDEQRARQVRGTGQQLVVDRQLFPRPVEVRDPLHPEHLLHLIPDRRAILEEERHAVTYGYPPHLFVGDDAAANRVATARIALPSEDILERDRPHHAVESSVLPSYAASRASTGW